MSTRRARIKAVTVLPPRRKNAENVVLKTIAPDKNATNDLTETPKTPKRFAENTTAPSPNKTVTEKSAPTVPSPALRSPQIAGNKPTTPKITSNLTASSKQSPGFLYKDPIEKRTLFSPPPNLVIRNPNAGKSIEKDNATKKVDENVNKDTGTPKSIQVIDCHTPSVPECIRDETMDGIVPLKPVVSGPKPIDLWKNEIISENAEVLFDPIVPLPSPSKVRPKVRPIPRLVPLRRSSVQGSASESEDESRRQLGASTPAHARQRHDSQTSHSTIHTTLNRELNRVRNDSMCSSISQQASHAPPPASPLKEKHISKQRRAEQARRAAALRRRRSPRPDTLTMYDLIFYNPTANPIVPDQDELKAKEANAKDALSQNGPDADVNAGKEEDVDDPPAGEAPVPQIKIGPNGEIILDEKSLVIKQSHTGRKVSTSVVREGAWSGGGGRYNRSARTADWSGEETVRFYRALAAAGTDFSLMTPLFPNRSRRDLKLKFKKEERLNSAQVDKALRSASTWDIARLQDEFREEREEAERQAQKEKERLQKWKEAERTIKTTSGARHSKGAKAVLGNTKGTVSKSLTANDIIEHAKQITKRRKQKDPQKNATQNTSSDKNKSSDNFSEKTTDQSNIRPVASTQVVPINLVAPNVPNNIEMGSLVVLTVNDPNTPSKKVLQTYISRGPGNLTPISLPPQLLNSVVNYMKVNKGTPKGGRSNTSSPAIEFPANVANSRNEPSPKRVRHSSFNITQL